MIRPLATPSRLALLITVVLFGFCFGLAVSPAVAEAAPALAVRANYVRGHVTVSVKSVPTGTRGVSFFVNGVRLSTGAVGYPYRSPTIHVGRVTRTVVAAGVDATGQVLWAAARVVDPAHYAPRIPFDLNPGASAVVKHRQTVRGDAYRPVTAVAVTVAGCRLLVRQSADRHFRAPGVRFPHGSRRMRVSARNGFGWSTRTVRVWQLGADDLVGRRRYCVVDKATFWQYYVAAGRLSKRWPVAIGMPATPTPRGTFYVGGPRPAGGSWGAIRRRLSKMVAGVKVRTSYYIHGTNDPDSIGRMASHGCVRMYNSGIRDHVRSVPNGTLVRIR